MKYHLGLLDEDPWQNRVYRWVRKGGWNHPAFPSDVRMQIATWVRMPGFEDRFHIRNLHLHQDSFLKMRKDLPSFDEVADLVAENWNSTTREDCIKLCKLRPGVRSGVPLICQLAMLDDLKRGMSQAQIARDFGLDSETVYRLKNRGIKRSPYWDLPAGFELLAYEA